MIKEEWKPVKDYEGYYEVSNCGNIRSSKTHKFLKQRLNKGYPVVKLHKDSKMSTKSVHRIVASAFIKNPLDKREVNHLDEDKINNNVANLQWCTAKENSNWGTRNKRISDTVSKLCKNGMTYIGRTRAILQIDCTTGEVIRKFSSITEAVKLYGYHQGNITFCCQGKFKQTSGYKWAYCDDPLSNTRKGVLFMF